jgi:hypothetical protein
MSTAVSKLPRRVAVERGIYHQGNDKYAVCFMVAGKPHFRTIGYDLGAARRERAALIERHGAARWRSPHSCASRRSPGAGSRASRRGSA